MAKVLELNRKLTGSGWGQNWIKAVEAELADRPLVIRKRQLQIVLMKQRRIKANFGLAFILN